MLNLRGKYQNRQFVAAISSAVCETRIPQIRTEAARPLKMTSKEKNAFHISRNCGKVKFLEESSGPQFHDITLVTKPTPRHLFLGIRGCMPTGPLIHGNLMEIRRRPPRSSVTECEVRGRLRGLWTARTDIFRRAQSIN